MPTGLGLRWAWMCGNSAVIAQHIDCFPTEFPLVYESCCRDVQSSNGLPYMYRQCFGSGFTWEVCCTFKYGPKLFGLPQACNSAVEDEDGAVSHYMGKTGSIRVLCGNLTLWATGYYAARFVTDMDSLLEASRSTWKSATPIFEVLVGTRLHILDVGCGAGLLSTTVAKVGHTFTAVDINPSAIALTKKNLQLNGLEASDKNFVVWDMAQTPTAALIGQGPWDIAVVEVSHLLMAKFNEDQHYGVDVLSAILLNLVPTLFSLPVRRFMFLGKYSFTTPTNTNIHWTTTATMYLLARLGRTKKFRRPCMADEKPQEDVTDGRCFRDPTISPKFWLHENGLAPPTDHWGFVIW
eukprot:TRINITY_DN22993_c0_g1_i1.p1 TRINITY_DN22993_c0_g1~~TRINITY_DN22993_c0_g1_i1.p1  ORF type:complete len:374 (+),score=37.51 TRINITY_DN22993_c0_g1_i1:72-1124(+)